MNNKSRRPRVILYLGAGASYYAGYQTFVTFPELLFNPQMRDAEGMPPLSPNSERLLIAIRESLRRNNKATTHDNFLWRLDGYTQFLRLNQCDDALQEFLKNNTRLYDLHICTEQAINQISATTIHHYSKNRVIAAKATKPNTYKNMKRIHNLYCQLAKLNGDPSWLPIFTTNYDMLIEDLFSEFSNDPDSCIPITNAIPCVTRENASWTPKLMGMNGQDKSGIYLWRLHGCVCWFYNAARAEITFLRKHAAEQEKTRMCVMYPGNETEYVGNDPYGFAFRSFYRNLQTCDLVVFVGFSFRDDDVMHILLKAMEERHGNLKLLIVDPLYTYEDVRDSLKASASRTTMPYRIPEADEIKSITMPFGENEYMDLSILSACNEILSRKGES
jgi:hypothetical protein